LVVLDDRHFGNLAQLASRSAQGDLEAIARPGRVGPWPERLQELIPGAGMAISSEKKTQHARTEGAFDPLNHSTVDP
jgi:hypothetical protein